MKKIIYAVGILFLSIVIILNVIFSANLDNSEHITVNTNTIFYAITLILAVIILYILSKSFNEFLYKDDEKRKRLRRDLFIFAVAIYLAFSAIWLILVRPGIGADQIHVANLAQTMYRGNLEEFLPNLTYAGIPLKEYVASYTQQIPLAFIFNIFFKIIHSDLIPLLRILNLIGNILIVTFLYKITCHLSKKYKVNKVLFLVLILTFLSLPMLSTFVYGDTLSLAFSLISVYLIMKYTETKSLKYALIASIFTMLAYMMRMNSLIFIIATVIYLLLAIFKERHESNLKQNLLKILVVAIYIIVGMAPTSLVKNYYLNKYNLEKNREYPTISYILISMEESWRGNGWYREDIGEYALKNPVAAKSEYPQRIKERITYFSQNIGYAFDFYVKKAASMWCENTYSAICQNLARQNDPVENLREPLEFHQKTLLVLSCACSLLVLIQKRRDLSLEVIFLITIFIGGFAFHMLWEAKSRYIIPYVVVLMPVASIYINKFKINTINN